MKNNKEDSRYVVVDKRDDTCSEMLMSIQDAKDCIVTDFEAAGIETGEVVICEVVPILRPIHHNVAWEEIK